MKPSAPQTCVIIARERIRAASRFGVGVAVFSVLIGLRSPQSSNDGYASVHEGHSNEQAPTAHAQPWTRFTELPPGATRQELYGDPARGPAYMYVRFPSGYSLPYHWHTATERIYVDAGVLELQVCSAAADALGLRGYALVPRRRSHRLACVSQEDCFFHLSSDARFDVQWSKEDCHVAETPRATALVVGRSDHRQVASHGRPPTTMPRWLLHPRPIRDQKW